MTTEIRQVQPGTPQVFRAPAGRSFLVVPDGPNAGTMTLEYSQDGVNYQSAPQGPSASSYSLCPDTYGVQAQGYVRASAGLSSGLAIASDYAQVRNVGIQSPVVCNINQFMASQIALATEQRLWSMRFPAGFLPQNFCASVDIQFSATNTAGVKTLKVYFGPSGAGGTALASVAATSLLNGRVLLDCYGGTDFVTVRGSSVGAGATALVSSTVAPWNQNEMEWCITATKATPAEALSIDRLRAELYTQ
jgi:hypothetical protein